MFDWFWQVYYHLSKHDELVNKITELEYKNKILTCKIKQIDSFVKIMNKINLDKCC